MDNNIIFIELKTFQQHMWKMGKTYYYFVTVLDLIAQHFTVCSMQMPCF